MTDLTDHLIRQRLENYDFLKSTGMHPDRIAQRLGISRNTLDKELERRASAQSHPERTARAGEEA